MNRNEKLSPNKLVDYLQKIEIIEEQQERFQRIMEACSALLYETDENKACDDVSCLLKELVFYHKSHFRIQEDLLLAGGSEDVQKHLKDHIFFIDKIDEFTLAQKYRNPLLLKNINTFLRKWHLSHIKNADEKFIRTFRDYLRRKS